MVSASQGFRSCPCIETVPVSVLVFELVLEIGSRELLFVTVTVGFVTVSCAGDTARETAVSAEGKIIVYETVKSAEKKEFARPLLL